MNNDTEIFIQEVKDKFEIKCKKCGSIIKLKANYMPQQVDCTEYTTITLHCKKCNEAADAIF